MTAGLTDWRRQWSWLQRSQRIRAADETDSRRERLPELWHRVLTIDKMTPQDGDEKIVPFSFMNDDLQKDQVKCWLTYTNEADARCDPSEFSQVGAVRRTDRRSRSEILPVD